jgi:hypothetical protein
MEALTKTRQRAGTAENTQTGLDTVSIGSIAVMGGISALIGLWALASLVSAMVSSGGPLALAMGWFQAISGL